MLLECSGLLFDMDGVLLDSRDIVERTWRRWAALHGRPAEPFLAVASGRRSRDTLRLVAPELATDEEVAWLDSAELLDFEGIRPIPGVMTLLNGLPPAAWTVVTSASRDIASGRLGAIGLALPANAVTSEAVTRGKPAPDGYLMGAERLRLAPGACLVVEDSPAGIAAGAAAGARVLGLTTTHTAAEVAAADMIAADLRSVRVTPGPRGLEIAIRP